MDNKHCKRDWNNMDNKSTVLQQRTRHYARCDGKRKNQKPMGKTAMTLDEVHNYLKKQKKWKTTREISEKINLSMGAIRKNIIGLIKRRMVTERMRTFKVPEYKVKNVTGRSL